MVSTASKHQAGISGIEREHAAKLHSSCIIVNSLGGGPTLFSEKMLDTLERMIAESKPMAEVIKVLEELSVSELLTNEDYRTQYFGMVKRAGVTAFSSTIGVGHNIDFSYSSAIKDLAIISTVFDNLGDHEVKVVKAEQIRTSKREGKLGVLLNFQNTTPLLYLGAESWKDNLALFSRFGVKIMQLTYNTRNPFGDGCTERTDGGLSNLGIELVEEMNRLGILVDVSHCGPKTTVDAIEASKKSVVFSHTCCAALSPHARNKADEQMKALADKDGYMGIAMVPSFLNSRQPEKASLEDFFKHIDYAVDLIGPKQVGIGTDWAMAGKSPKALNDLMNKEAVGKLGFRKEDKIDYNVNPEGPQWGGDEKWLRITEGLITRGYSDADIRGILGENFLRVFDKVVG